MPIINDIPQGNVTSPLGAHMRYATKFDKDTLTITELNVSDYDLVFTEEDDETVIGGGVTSATNITVTPTGSITSTNVQAALAELDAELAKKTSVTVDQSFSTTSTNPPSSKIVATELNTKVPKTGGQVSGRLDTTGIINNGDIHTTNMFVNTALNVSGPTTTTGLTNNGNATVTQGLVVGSFSCNGEGALGPASRVTSQPIANNGLRNIKISTQSPTASDGADGDIWIVYQA